MPTDLKTVGGTPVYVTGTGRSIVSASQPSLSPSNLSAALHSLRSSTTTPSVSSSSLSDGLYDISTSSSFSSSPSQISPPPAYNSIYPPSPPSSAPSSPDSALVGQTRPSSLTKIYSNPLQSALNVPSTPIKPLLTPQSSDEDFVTIASLKSDNNNKRNGVDLLTLIFPSASPIHALPATAVSLDEIVPKWKGAVLENPAMGTRTLYVSGGSYEDVSLRESVCGVLEKAEEELGCSGVVMCLKKNTPHLGDLLHSLMYVGGTITTLPYPANSAYILVGLDL